MPRRKPEKVEEIRFSLSDFERDQIRDLKMINGIRAASPAIAGIAVGAGLVLGATFFGSTLEELKDWWGDQWKADEKTLQQNEKAATETPAVAPNDTPFTIPESLEGMSPAAIYDHVADVRGNLISQQYHLWRVEVGRDDNGESWRYFLDNTTGLLKNFRKVATTITDDTNNISPFTYQMLIRETAARRAAGITTSTLSGFITAGYGFIVGPLTWAIGNAINPNEWTSSDVRDAAGYLYDPLLSLAWGRIDFTGVDAPVQFSVLDLAWAEFNSGVPLEEYESRMLSVWSDQQSDPTHLSEWWP